MTSSTVHALFSTVTTLEVFYTLQHAQLVKLIDFCHPLLKTELFRYRRKKELWKGLRELLFPQCLYSPPFIGDIIKIV